jgi:GntR family transcriptional repressor for pyruvate dehydrogenase complex
VRLVIECASEKDIAALQKRCDEMERLLSEGAGDSPEFVSADVAFHLALGKATHNELVEKIYGFTIELFTPTIAETHRNSPEAANLALSLHRNIIMAIVKKDVELGRRAVAESLETWQNLY